MAQVNQKNKDYWKKRFEELENSQYHQSAAYYKDLQKQFHEASNSIQMDIERWYRRLADHNGISYAEAKGFLKSSELEEFKWTVGEYIKAGKENAIDQRWLKELENASARHHISYLEAMKLQTQQHAELLFTEFEGGMTDFLSKSYGKQFYHTAFEVAKTTGIGTNLAKIDTRRIDTIIKKPWAQDGENFSSRIWANKEKLVNNLHTELSQSIIRGADPRQAINNLAKTMQVSRAQAGRLVMTESAAISSAAQKDCFKELGVEQYEILATLDNRTSDICQEMDRKVFDRKDYEVGVTAPPFHPNCRSTTIPYFDDEFTAGEERAARGEDGKTYYVPASMKYEEWEKQFVKSGASRETNTSPENQKRSNENLNRVTNELKGELTKYTDRESKWSGNVVIDNKRALNEGFRGMKSWSCNIVVSDDVTDDTLFHELLHSASSSYYSVKDLIENRSMEEGVVELITKIFAKQNGLNYIPAYVDEVAVLENLNSGLRLFNDDVNFAKALFSIPMPKRYEWLNEKVENAIIIQNVPTKNADEIREFMSFLKPGGGK